MSMITHSDDIDWMAVMSGWERRVKELEKKLALAIRSFNTIKESGCGCSCCNADRDIADVALERIGT